MGTDSVRRTLRDHASRQMASSMKNHDERIIAIDPRGCSFAFAVFEGPSRLLDWGVRSFRHGVNAVKIPASEKFAALLDYFSPDMVVARTRAVIEGKLGGSFGFVGGSGGSHTTTQESN